MATQHCECNLDGVLGKTFGNIMEAYSWYYQYVDSVEQGVTSEQKQKGFNETVKISEDGMLTVVRCPVHLSLEEMESVCRA